MISKYSEISKKAKIGTNVKIWSYSQIREGAEIGNNCIIGRNVCIDHDVKIGSNVKIQNNALIYFETIIKDNVFIGPGTIITNDKYPRATVRGKLKVASDWKAEKTIIEKGASVGAGTIILPGLKIGANSLVGAGSVVTHTVDNYAKVTGNPAKIIGYVCEIGHSLKDTRIKNTMHCQICKKNFKVR